MEHTRADRGVAMAEDERLKLQCHCGWNVEGDRATVVNETQAHVAKVHWTEATEEEVLEMATPA